MQSRIGTASIIILTLVLILAACSGGGGGSSSTTTPPSASLISITVTPTNPTIAKGISKQFSAVGFYSDNTSHDITTTVTWGSSDTSKATVDTFGRATGIAAGSTTITASVGTINGTDTLTVTNASLVSMTVTPASPSIAKGTSQQFSVIGIFSDNTLQDLTGQVTWSSSDSAKATINSNGIATGVAAGSATITATSGSTTANATLAVTNATLLSLAVTPVNPSTVAGATQQFTAMGTFSDATAQDLSTQVAWTSSDTSKATIDTNGLATAVAAGTSTITAKSGSITASAGLTVTAAPTNAPPAGSVQLSGTVQPDPGDPSASGQQSGATVYVVGQQNSGTKTDSNGNFTLNVNPQLSGTVLASPGIKRVAGAGAVSRVATGTQTISYGIVVVDTNDSHGVKGNVLIVTDQTNTCPTLYINTVGAISGHAYLQGQTDNSGITVYLPGTSFSAITAADGSYTMSGVPSGTYDFLRAEKFGTTYHYAIQSGVTVTTTQTTTVADMTLQLSTGPFGGIMINNGAVFTNNKDVTLSIAPSSDAVLMSVSSDPNFVGAVWQPVQATIPFSFPSPYPSGGATVNAYVKFAQESGLTSDPTTTSIYLDTNPQTTMVAPVSVTMSQTPTLQWAYAPPMPNPQYRVQLSSVSDFSSTIVDQNNLSTTQYAVATTLSQGTYYWRVAIIYNGTQLSWGPTWSFTINRNAGTPLTPTNMSSSNNATPQFTWSPNTAASSYGFVLSTNSNLTSPVVNVTGIIGSSYGPLLTPLPGTPSTTYYWAITPYDSLGNPGTQSGVMQFTLDTIAPSGSITINNNDVFTGTRNVTLNLSASDALATGVNAYFVSETGAPSGVNDSRWVPVTQTASLATTTTFTLSPTSGVKTVNVYYKDIVGNISGAFSDTINLINFTDNIATIDSGGVGRYPSIALGYSGNFGEYSAVIAYTDLLNTGVKFLTNEPGTWTTPIYLVPTSSGSTPWSEANHSIAYATNAPASVHVVYSDGGLKHAYKSNIGQQPWATGDLIDASGGLLWTASIASASTGSSWAYVSYQGAWTGSASPLTFATNTTGSWVKTNVDSTAGVNAMYTSIALDPDNQHVHISYYDGNSLAGTGNKVLKYATNKTGSWVVTTVDNSSSDVGWFSSIAVDSANIHIAYVDNANHFIKYATKPLSGGTWTITTVDSNSSNIGAYPYNLQPISIAVDTTQTSNNVFISYANWGSYGLKLATNLFGSWATSYVDQYNYASNPVVPIDSSLAVVGGTFIGGTHMRIDMTYFDNQGKVLKYTTGLY